MLDLLVWVGVIIFYLLNLFLKKLSKDGGGTVETSPYSDNGPYKEIRREILKKKKDREGLKDTEVPLAMEADKAREDEAVQPSQFEMHLEKQSRIIKEKQDEAERLKIHLKQMNSEVLNEIPVPSRAFHSRPTFARGKIRSILTGKSDIKAALIAGEVLASPLALRSGIKS